MQGGAIITVILCTCTASAAYHIVQGKGEKIIHGMNGSPSDGSWCILIALMLESDWPREKGKGVEEGIEEGMEEEVEEGGGERRR